MQLSVKGKQLDVGESLRRHVADALESIVDKYAGRAIEANVVLSRDAHLICSDISVHVRRDIVVQAHAEADEAYAAFDTAADRVAKRLRRYKRRLHDQRTRPRAAGPGDGEAEEVMTARTYVLAPEPEEEDAPAAGDQPVVVAETATEIPSLTVGEAVMRMDLADVPAFLFKNRAHGGLNVIYRRRDGHIGWVDPDAGAGRWQNGSEEGREG
jgi:ribosomal subunit interface protein